MYEPLRGVRVLDIGFFVPGPMTTMRLSQLGADVVKVELPGTGDRMRAMPGHAGDPLMALFAVINRGKRSIAIDLNTPEGLEQFQALAACADVIVENAMPGRWARSGIDFEALRKQRPELIVCSVTGYGQTGPLSMMPAHSVNTDAQAGCLTVVPTVDGHYGVEGGGPGGSNELGTIQAALAICAALVAKERTGEGAWIDISCWDAAVEARRTSLVETAFDGYPTGRPSSGTPSVRRSAGAFSSAYRTLDGKFVVLQMLEPKFWANFCKGAGREDLIGRHGGKLLDQGPDDPGLRDEIQGIIGQATAEEWGRRFIDWDVAGGPIATPDDVLAHPHFRDRGMLEYEGAGTWSNMASPVRWHHTGERAGAGLARPPEVDEHHDEILRDWLDGPN